MTGSVHVALLRGINVGGRNTLPMAVLARAFEAAGAQDVTTYIQSGNVVYRGVAAKAHRVPERVRNDLATAHRLDVPIVTRTREELAAVVAGNPFTSDDNDAKTLHVAFLAERPDDARVAGLDPDRSPPDRFAVRGREVYIHTPNGAAKTRITNAWLDAQLGTTSTVRNWRTTLRLLQIAEGL